jgi:hypothetical protein
LADAHGIYVSATRKAQKSSLPKSPPHLGGPMPELSVFETVELAITLARLALGKRPSPRGDALVDFAEQQLSWARGGKKGPEPTQRADEPAPAKRMGPSWAIARAALMEARHLEHVRRANTVGRELLVDLADGIHFSGGLVDPRLLAGVSCGAVFMGANTYIGNGPNLMVAAIAREEGVPMPSFFGYMLWSGGILIPVFAVITFVIF